MQPPIRKIKWKTILKIRRKKSAGTPGKRQGSLTVCHGSGSRLQHCIGVLQAGPGKVAGRHPLNRCTGLRLFPPVMFQLPLTVLHMRQQPSSSSVAMLPLTCGNDPGTWTLLPTRRPGWAISHLWQMSPRGRGNMMVTHNTGNRGFLVRS